MCLYGVKGLAIGSGRGSRVSCSLINGSMIGLARSTFKRNGTEAAMPSMYHNYIRLNPRGLLRYERVRMTTK